jgi:hypothetical protein
MTMATMTPDLAALSALLDPALPRFRAGELVVIAGAQPLVCVVLEEATDGLLRLSRAACPEMRFLANSSEVQHLSAWLTTQLLPVGRETSADGGE